MSINLTLEQSKPVFSNCKINVCLACPGSGKTTVLIARAERLWKEFAEPILIVTFSVDACNNIIKRITPEIKTHITVKTIHSFCYDIVRSYWKELGELVGGEDWPPEPRIITKDQELAIITELFPAENFSQLFDTFSYLRSLATPPDQILRLFKKKVYFDRTRQSDIEKFILFEKTRISKGLINFDDMVDLAEVLTPLPFVSTDLVRKFSHILIDEAQDTSEQQWRILRPLVLNAITSMVVGDYNQAVYGFRNADGSVLLNMSYMKDSVTFRLSQSFRSGSVISKLANMICYDKSSQIVPQSHLGDLKLRKFENAQEEVNWVLQYINKETAIISRTNSYLELFERACIDNKILYSGKSFYRSRHILDLYSFVGEYSGSDLLKVIDKAYVDNTSYTKNEIEDFKVAKRIIKEEGVDTFCELVENSLRLSGEGVTLTTGHASKGLEWDRVFVVGCHTGHVPHKAATDDREERNLLYVMTSRARDELIITCVNEPSVYLPKEVRNGP